MKKYIKYTLYLALVFGLVACSHKNTELPTQESSTRQSSTTSSSQESSFQEVEEKQRTIASSSQEVTPQEYYAEIIDKYAQLSSAGLSGITTLFADSDNDELVSARFVAEASSYGHTKQYAFYDINHDMIDELLIGTADSITAVYYLEDEEPTIIKAAGVASSGGLRASLEIYQNGSIVYTEGNSFSPNWTATNYQIKNGQLVQETQVYYTFGKSDVEDLLGLIGQTKVDLTTLSWQDFAK